MRAAQKLYVNHGFSPIEGDILNEEGEILILGFGAKDILLEEDIYEKLKSEYPRAHIILASTSGEIYQEQVFDETVSVMIMQFEKTRVVPVSIQINKENGSFEAGKNLFNTLYKEDLVHILILSDGGLVNGSELVNGLEADNKTKIPITGGLAGDAANFQSTLVGYNSQPGIGNIVGIGFYGQHLRVGYGSYGGFETFGPEKKVTKSKSNHLFEIENKSALDLYKQYLGVYAQDLPGSALLFPLNVRLEGETHTLVRTILSIDTEADSMTFAGDIPEGSYVRFMKSNFDTIIHGAGIAAGNSMNPNKTNQNPPKMALLISCVGRKLILGSRTEEENEAVKEIFGNNTLISGFYSYGEICPHDYFSKSELNNQTMTITTFDEDLEHIPVS